MKQNKCIITILATFTLLSTIAFARNTAKTLDLSKKFKDTQVETEISMDVKLNILVKNLGAKPLVQVIEDESLVSQCLGVSYEIKSARGGRFYIISLNAEYNYDDGGNYCGVKISQPDQTSSDVVFGFDITD